MTKVSNWFIPLAIFTAYFIGASAQDVGRGLPESTVSIWLPYEVATIILVPAFFGYMAGREENE